MDRPASIVGRLAALAVARPDAVLVEEWTAEGELCSRWTAAEVWQRTSALGAQVRDRAEPGTAVALVVVPGVDAVVAQCAVAWAGCTFVPLNPGAPGPELERDVRTARCGFAVVDQRLGPARQAVLAAAIGREPLLIDDVHHDDHHGDPGADRPPSPRDPAAIVFTSGSTAAPRGAVFTQAALVRAADESVDVFELTAADRLLCNLPLHHVAGNVSLVWPAITVGATLVVVPFTAGRFFELAAETEVTFGIVNATHIRTIEAKGALKVAHRLRRAATGFSLAADRLHAFEERFGIAMLNGYGFTEALGHVTSQRLGTERTAGSAGVPIGGRDVLIVAEDGSPAPAGTIGEIVVTWSDPDEVTTGYVGDPTATEELLGRGAIRTGDLGYLSVEGELFFADRLKDVMKRGGVTVSPAEIEAVIALHPWVQETAVVAVPSEVHGEEPVAVVLAATGADLDALAASVLELCAAHLDRHKVPVDVVVVDELPRLTIGKVDKRALRDRIIQSGTPG